MTTEDTNTTAVAGPLLTEQLGPTPPLAARLREAANAQGPEWDTADSALMREAADEIERLCADIGPLLSSVTALEAERQKMLDTVRMLNGMFSRNVMAMQAALIDKVLRGHHEGWAWIINTLEGPDLLPDFEDARKRGGAQAWFDAELAAEEARVAGLGA